MIEMLHEGKIWLGGRVVLRDVTPADGYLVAYWRNSPRARAAFHTRSVLTPAMHSHFLASKSLLDCVWIAEHKRTGAVIGMTSLTMDAENSAECGRMFVDERYTRQGYATELEFTRVAVAFEFFQVGSVWLEVYADNEPMLCIHDKIGWTPAGVNVPGHKGQGGDVLLFTLSRERWAEVRPGAIERYEWRLPEWIP